MTGQAARPEPVTFGAALATTVAMAIGSVGPWAYSSDLSVTLNGIDRDGRVTLALAIGVAVLLLAHRQVKGLPTGPLIGAVLTGAVCVAILAVDLADIRDKQLTVRWGIVVDVVGAALVIVSSSILIWQARTRRTATPSGDAPVLPTASEGQAASTSMASKLADWYPDPHGEARLRYWDGSRWTEHTAP